jgi:hypothetical protein
MQVRTGVEPSEALMALVPEAYRNHPDLVKTYPEVGAAPTPLCLYCPVHQNHRVHGIIVYAQYHRACTVSLCMHCITVYAQYHRVCTVSPCMHSITVYAPKHHQIHCSPLKT